MRVYAKMLAAVVLFVSVVFAGGCSASTTASFDPSYEDTVLLANSLFKKFDKDGDGFLSKEEFNNMKFRSFIKRHDKSFAQFNKNFANFQKTGKMW